MKEVVYALSDKGARERAAAQSSLPAELRDLLRLVDGRRTGHDLLAAAGKNALTAGGLRWLTATGYIFPSEPAPLSPEPAPQPAAPALNGPVAGAAAREELDTAALPDHPDDVCRAMSNFMLRSIQRHLRHYPHAPQIAAATTLGELLPHLHPLLDAIVARAGAEAGAEFADTAAFLLQPPRRAAR